MTTQKTTAVRKKNPASTALAATPEPASPATATPDALLSELRELILSSRQTVAQAVNSALVMLYWQMGQRIRSDILKEKRAGYGEEIFHALSGKLTAEFGRGFTKTNLFNMVRCAEVFPDAKIVSALSAKWKGAAFI